MGKMSDTTLDFNNMVQEQENHDDIHKKETELYEDNINNKYSDLERRKSERDRQKKFDLRTRNVSYIKKKQKDTKEYLTLAKKSQVFLDDDIFKGVVPFFAKNIILVGSLSGDGKSTTCANVAYSAIRKGKKVLVISNEEDASDVYNRVTCLLEGWSYTNHAEFKPYMIDKFAENIDKLSHRLTVIDDSWDGGIGMTSTIEGVETILNHLRTDKVEFDVIVWDYYQNISRSTNNPKASPYDCQERFSSLLDSFKNNYPGVNFVLAQLKPGDEPFQYKIQGRKIIYEKATCAIEIKAERERFATSWTIHKARWSETLNKTYWTGYKKGKYVPYTTEFETDADMQSIINNTQQKRTKRSVKTGLGDVKMTGFGDEKDD